MVNRFATAVFAAMLLAGCSAQPAPRSEPSSSPDAHSYSHAAKEAFAHIHGLSALTNSDEITVATHAGVFEVSRAGESSTARGPIGDLDIDAMGFSRTAEVIFASGHPGAKTPSSFGSPNLGLITSVDEGETWATVSLKGQADFHALATHPTDGVTMYGLMSSSPKLQVSTDGGLTWSGGAELAARDILVDANSPSTVFATTADGLQKSTDSGRTFSVEADAPPLYLLTANPADGSLVGIDTTGTVWSKVASGEWVKGGQVAGAPQAMTIAPGDSTLIVADDRGISASSDFGLTWEKVWPAE